MGIPKSDVIPSKTVYSNQRSVSNPPNGTSVRKSRRNSQKNSLRERQVSQSMVNDGVLEESPEMSDDSVINFNRCNQLSKPTLVLCQTYHLVCLPYQSTSS